MVTRQLRAECAPHSFLDIKPRQLLREQEFCLLIICLSLLEIVWKMPYVVVPILFDCTSIPTQITSRGITDGADVGKG